MSNSRQTPPSSRRDWPTATRPRCTATTARIPPLRRVRIRPARTPADSWRRCVRRIDSPAGVAANRETAPERGAPVLPFECHAVMPMRDHGAAGGAHTSQPKADTWRVTHKMLMKRAAAHFQVRRAKPLRLRNGHERLVASRLLQPTADVHRKGWSQEYRRAKPSTSLGPLPDCGAP